MTGIGQGKMTELEDKSTETYKIEMQRQKNNLQDGTEYPKTVGQLKMVWHMDNGITTKKWHKGTEEAKMT